MKRYYFLLLCLFGWSWADPATPAKKKPAAPPPADATDPPKKKTPPADGEEKPAADAEKSAAPLVSLKPEALEDFAQHPEAIRNLLTYGLSLTEKKLTYKYASADPTLGGMDCSGFVYHVLQHSGWKDVPRQSNEMYAWAWKAGLFRAFNGMTMDSFEMAELKPGDLLFWVNTTRAKSDRDPPITHVMIYLGREKSRECAVMIGSSDGRSYDGVSRFGVSVFDFKLPREESTARFVGYAHLPKLKP